MKTRHQAGSLRARVHRALRIGASGADLVVAFVVVTAVGLVRLGPSALYGIYARTWRKDDDR